MTLRHLKIFVAVCESGSATKAGEKLFLAQPSVSLAIAELEEYYGIKLFDRIARRLHITESGKRFLQYATHIVSLFEDMEKEVKNFESMGVLRIGASITIGNYLLPDYVKRFKEAYPQMEIRAVIDNSDKIQQYVLSNQIDIGLIEGMVHSTYLVESRFRDDELVMICGKEHSFAGQKEIEPKQLLGETLILREAGSAGREIFDSTMLSNGVEITPAWQSVSTQAIIRAVKVNLGISVLPFLLVEEAIKNGELTTFALKNIRFLRSFCVIHHQNKFLTKTAKDFIGLCC